MTRNREMYFEEECEHRPVLPVVTEDGQEILHWICDCGKKVADKNGKTLQPKGQHRGKR